MVYSQIFPQMLYAHMSEIRSCDHMTQMATCVVKINMATKVRIQFYRFISQIFLDFDASVSRKSA